MYCLFSALLEGMFCWSPAPFALLCSHFPFSYPLGSRCLPGRSGRFISMRFHLSHPLKHCLLVSGKWKASSPCQKKHFHSGYGFLSATFLEKCSFMTTMVFCKMRSLDGFLCWGLVCYSIELHAQDSLQQHICCFTLFEWCKTDGSTWMSYTEHQEVL